MILRAHPLGYECVGQVTNQLSDQILGKQASEGFEVLIGDDDLLNKQNFATIKVCV